MQSQFHPTESIVFITTESELSLWAIMRVPCWRSAEKCLLTVADPLRVHVLTIRSNQRKDTSVSNLYDANSVYSSHVLCGVLCVRRSFRWLGQWLLANNPNKPAVGEVDE